MYVMGLSGKETELQSVSAQEFSAFVGLVESRLRRALAATWGPEVGREATAEALAWAWENWTSVQSMENAAGYLYRVGASRVRPRRKPIEDYRRLLTGTDDGAKFDPDQRHFEPGLADALTHLSDRQRTVVVLVHGCGWTHQEVADALELSRSSVATHLDRALDGLRAELGVDHDG